MVTTFALTNGSFWNPKNDNVLFVRRANFDFAQISWVGIDAMTVPIDWLDRDLWHLVQESESNDFKDVTQICVAFPVREEVWKDFLTKFDEV